MYGNSNFARDIEIDEILKELPEDSSLVEFTVSNYFDYQKMKNLEVSKCSCENCESTWKEHHKRNQSVVCVVCHKECVYLNCKNFYDEYTQDYYVFCFTCERKVTSVIHNIL